MSARLVLGLIITAVLVLLVYYMVLDRSKSENMGQVAELVSADVFGPKENMISEGDIMQMSRGFNVPFTKDYPEILMLSEAELADHIDEISLDPRFGPN